MWQYWYANNPLPKVFELYDPQLDAAAQNPYYINPTAKCDVKVVGGSRHNADNLLLLLKTLICQMKIRGELREDINVYIWGMVQPGDVDPRCFPEIISKLQPAGGILPHDADFTCMICLEKVLENRVSLYPCRHRMCSPCYDTFLTGPHASNCPVCKTQIGLEVH